MAHNLVSEYINILSDYQKLYGTNTVVLMQVGSFYEMYGIDNDTEQIGNVQYVSKLLNIILTKRNKNIQYNNRNNPLMLGFPCVALNKYIPILLEDGFTIIVVDQTKTGLSINRKVTNVISLPTYIEGNHDEYVVLIYVESSLAKNKLFHIGVSAINILTGKSSVHECNSLPTDPYLALEEAGSFAQQYRPREIIISSFSSLLDELQSASIDQHIGLSDNIKFTYRYVNNIASNISYQNTIIGSIWNNNTMMSNIEFLDLELKPLAVTSYVLIIEYIYEHKPLLIKKLSKPEIFIKNNHLVLATNTLEQLNILYYNKHKKNNNAYNCLFDVINNCSTNMGKRLLKKRLLSPIYNSNELEHRYQLIDDFKLMFDSSSLSKLEKILDKIGDIETVQRRMSLNIITPTEFANLYNSHCVTIQLHEFIQDYIVPNTLQIQNITLTYDDIQSIQAFINTCNIIFNINVIFTCNNDYSMIFSKGQFDDIDNINNKIQHYTETITRIADNLSSLIGDTNSVKIECLKYNIYYLTVPNGKAKKLKEALNKQQHDFTFVSNKTCTRITSNKIHSIGIKLSNLTNELKICTKQKYNIVIRKLYSLYVDIFYKVISYVSELDVTKSNYKTAIKYNYCRPVIYNSKIHNFSHISSSFIKANNLRHAIIERFDRGVEYVPNDLEIGISYNGIVLYSMNSGGKTTLLKACGISIILAQMGSFVPATSFIFHPFNKLITRIVSDDNITKGRSSFVSEMYELRNILNRADNQTLVLADEITHGTEHISGSAIFTSSVLYLAEKNVNFMFTTHLHNVYIHIKDIINVKVYHLSVFIQDNNIIFERKLHDGPGSSIYGLEVCEFMDMDPEFIAKAYHIRNKIDYNKQSSLLNVKKSKYNTNMIVQTCKICNYSPSCNTDIPLDVHHIKEQCKANSHNLIGNVHKNFKSNLVVLCKQCHNKVHNGNIIIQGYTETTKGINIVMTIIN